MSELPDWPDHSDLEIGEGPPSEFLGQLVMHHRHKAACWESRCRLAVEALEEYEQQSPEIAITAENALAAIGQLPPAQQ